MGKIFKALEKAEKKETVKRGKYSAANAKKADPPVIDGSEQRKPVVLSRRATVDEAPSMGLRKPLPADGANVVERIEMDRNDIPAPPLADKSTITATASMPDDKTMEEMAAEKAPPPMENKGFSVTRSPYGDKEEKKESETRTLQDVADTPASDRNSRDETVRIDKPSVAKDGGFNGRTEDEGEKKSVNVQYSKTRVQVNDPENLKNNRVLSIFDDDDTANQFKILRTQVLRKLKAIDGNSILVTSANPYEGKTFTSINLGLSIAKEFDRTVLIIDADIRRPTKHHTDFSTEFFSLKVDKGLTDFLMGDAEIEDIMINPGIDKITLIPGGVPVDNSPELLNSSRMEKMMAEIKSRYSSDRLIIIDGPALLHFPDAMILYRYVDGVLPVVESEKTSADDLRKVMKQLKDVNLLGVVLNKKRVGGDEKWR